MSKNNVLMGVLAGLAAGALIGVLFAPDKGTETRKMISKKTSDSVGELKNKFNQLLGTLTEKFEFAKDKTNNVKKEAEIAMN